MIVGTVALLALALLLGLPPVLLGGPVTKTQDEIGGSLLFSLGPGFIVSLLGGLWWPKDWPFVVNPVIAFGLSGFGACFLAVFFGRRLRPTPTADDSAPERSEPGKGPL